MRLVTWNCNKGPYAEKVALLDTLTADIAVIQECPRPEVESENCLWFGDNPKQGITILAPPPYRLRRPPMLEDVPKFVVPIEVVGPVDLILFAVWSKTGQRYRYVQAVVKAVEMYRDWFAGSPCVLMGDLNSNVKWDREHPVALNHSALVALLDSLGLVSAYHGFHDEEQGQETRPTFYHLKRKETPYHIDYCFVPAAWAKQVRRVDIGVHDDWLVHSDHCPLLVDVAVDIKGEPPT